MAVNGTLHSGQNYEGRFIILSLWLQPGPSIVLLESLRSCALTSSKDPSALYFCAWYCKILRNHELVTSRQVMTLLRETHFRKLISKAVKSDGVIKMKKKWCRIRRVLTQLFDLLLVVYIRECLH